MYMSLFVCLSTVCVQVPKEARRRISSFTSPDPIISSVLSAEPSPTSPPNPEILYRSVSHWPQYLLSVGTIKCAAYQPPELSMGTSFAPLEPATSLSWDLLAARPEGTQTPSSDFLSSCSTGTLMQINSMGVVGGGGGNRTSVIPWLSGTKLQSRWTSETDRLG